MKTHLIHALVFCVAIFASISARALQRIEIASDHTNFVFAGTKEFFYPHGFNYDRDYKMRLIEEYWDTEWETVAQDFREMKDLGANVIRLHLQLAKFMDEPDKPNQRSLDQLKRVLKLAEQTGLYLDLTGLACYRKAAVPAWFNRLDENGRWRAQANFWSAIAKCCAESPAVFCYDLINEPVVPEKKSSDWLVGQLAGFYYVQAIALDPGNRSRSSMSLAWTKQMRSAIRRHDKKHLITIGLLPNCADSPSGSGFIPKDLAHSLDFISVHIYPQSKKFKEELANLRKFSVDKPVVIEETFPMGCSSAELKDFLTASSFIANGWVSFYWGQTPAELANSKSIGDSILRDWLNVVRPLNLHPPQLDTR